MFHPSRRLALLLGCAGILSLAAFGCDDDDDDESEGRCETCPACTTSGGGSTTSTTGSGGAGGAEVVPLKEAKLLIEHNATDLDTGFQGFLDSEGWQRMDVTGPNGMVLRLEGQGPLHDLGLTELFFETVEPTNADVPLEELLAQLPEGEYTFQGPTTDGNVTMGTALLTHDIPAGPVLVTPAEDAVVPTANLVMSWEPVTETIMGGAANIISYQLIVEKDQAPHPHAFAKPVMSIFVRPSVTSVTVPSEFLEPATTYDWEVLAIEESGNQTLSSSQFTTE